MIRYTYELMIVTLLVHMIGTLSYSIRLNSVKSKQFALSASLFNIISLISNTANMFQGPLMGGLIGYYILINQDPIIEIRKIILASSAGTLIGILLIPTFLKIFSIAVSKLELTGSVPSLVVQALSVANIKRMAKSATRPSKSMLSGVKFREIPKRLLLLNTIITGIYTIGVLAAYYAAILVPAEHRLAASGSSGLINGIATLLLSFFIDPQSAIITDKVMREERPYNDVKALVIMLIGTKFLGTILGQFLIIPAANIIAVFFK